MVQAFHEVGFRSRTHPAVPVEVLDYCELVDRVRPELLAAAQRPTFGIMFVVCGGSGYHHVDFDPVRLTPGRVVYVRPGQVQRWDTSSDVDARLVLARAELCRTGPWFPGEAAHRDLDPDSMTTAVELTAALEREQQRSAADAASIRLIAELYSALVTLFERAVPVERTMELPEPYLAFRAAVETDLTRSRDARAYMADLAFSERTVNRACQRATGRTAKGVLDDRLLLEAKRWLAHTDLPIGAVAGALGFSETANFNKFFARLAGQRPTVFRNVVRDAGYAAETTE